MVDLKKEIKLSDLMPKRKPKPPAEDGPAPEPGAEKEKKEKKPLLKRDLSFKRKPKAPRADKAEGEPKAKKERGRREPSGPKRGKRLVGLKIGASQLAAARVVNNGVPELVQVARRSSIPASWSAASSASPSCSPTRSECVLPQAQASAPGRPARHREQPDRRPHPRDPGIADAQQLENAVRFRAQEVLPIPLDEAVLDFQVLGERTDEEGNPVARILLVVAYRELVDRYVSACKKAGLRLVGIDLEAFALLRAIGEPRPEADGPAEAAVVVVSIGHDRSTFAVSDGRICEFTRVLEWGGATLDVAIARELDMTPSEAEPVKHAAHAQSTRACPKA